MAGRQAGSGRTARLPAAAGSSRRRNSGSRGIAKSFGGIKAVQDVSFCVKDRTLHALIGPNGAGKTTAFNLISGMYTPDAGSVTLDGRADRRPDARAPSLRPASAARSRSPICSRR